MGHGDDGTSSAGSTRLDGDAARREQAKTKRSPLKWARDHPLGSLATFSDNQVFEQFILVMILLNSIWIGVDLEMNNNSNLFIVAGAFELFSFVETIFCVIFTFEIVVRFFAYKMPHYFFLDEFMWHWNIFDLTLVFLMILELWIMASPLRPFDVDLHRRIHADPSLKEDGLAALSSFRSIRLLRISRMIRMIRMLPELFMMVKSMLAATRGVASTLLLMGMLLYVFAVVFTVWGKDQEDELMVAQFGNLGESYLTFIQILVYDDAFYVIRPTFNHNLLMGSLMIVFMVLGCFTVLNMLIGVIVEIVQATQQREADILLLGKIAEVFDTMDTNANGSLSKVEFQNGMDVLESVGVSRETCVLAVDILEDESVDLNEFVDLVFKLLRPIQSQDVIQVSAALQKLCDFHGVKTGSIVPDLEKANGASADDAVANVDSAGSSSAASSSEGSADGEEGGEGQGDEAQEAQMNVDEELIVIDEELLHETGCSQSFAKSQPFHIFILSIIIANAVWIGVELEANDPNYDWGNGLLGVSGGDGFFQKLLHGWSPYEVVEQLFMLIFLFEISVRWLAYKRPLHFFTDESVRLWNIFDLVLVGLMVFENVVVKFFTANSNLKMLSILRLLRLLRLSRLLRSSPEMATLIKSLAAAIRSVGSTMALLLGLLYVGAVVMTQWGQRQGDCPPGSVLGDASCGLGMSTDLFGGIFASMMTLLQLLVFDDAMEVVRAVMYRSIPVGMFLLLFMLGGAFTVLNMLIGVICDIVEKTKRKEEDRLMREHCVEVFQEFDTDNSGTLTREEFMERKELVGKIGLDIDTCRVAFDLRDTDGKGVLSLNEFMTMCFKLTQPPQAHDVLVIKTNLGRLAKKLGAVEATRLGSLKVADAAIEEPKALLAVDDAASSSGSAGGSSDSESTTGGENRAYWAIQAPGSANAFSATEQRRKADMAPTVSISSSVSQKSGRRGELDMTREERMEYFNIRDFSTRKETPAEKRRR